MSLHFFADQCIPKSVVDSLRNAGYQVYILKEYMPKTSEDSVMIAKAQELDSVLISLNGDFSNIVNYPPQNYRGIIALQVTIPKLFPVSWSD